MSEMETSGCEQHPNYTGMRLGKKVRDCPTCKAFYEKKRTEGARENRNYGPRKNKEAAEEREESAVVVANEVVDDLEDEELWRMIYIGNDRIATGPQDEQDSVDDNVEEEVVDEEAEIDEEEDDDFDDDLDLEDDDLFGDDLEDIL